VSTLLIWNVATGRTQGTSYLHDVQDADKEKEQRQLESLHHIRTRELEQMLRLKALEDRRLHLGKVVRDEERQQRLSSEGQTYNSIRNS
jgi:hypothetical protein